MTSLIPAILNDPKIFKNMKNVINFFTKLLWKSVNNSCDV